MVLSWYNICSYFHNASSQTLHPSPPPPPFWLLMSPWYQFWVFRNKNLNLYPWWHEYQASTERLCISYTCKRSKKLFEKWLLFTASKMAQHPIPKGRFTCCEHLARRSYPVMSVTRSYKCIDVKMKRTTANNSNSYKNRTKGRSRSTKQQKKNYLYDWNNRWSTKPRNETKCEQILRFTMDTAINSRSRQADWSFVCGTIKKWSTFKKRKEWALAACTKSRSLDHPRDSLGIWNPRQTFHAQSPGAIWRGRWRWAFKVSWTVFYFRFQVLVSRTLS